MLHSELGAQLQLAAKRHQGRPGLPGYLGRLGEMGHLRRLGGRWSALGGARRPRPPPSAVHRPCRPPGPQFAHPVPRTTAQAPTRRPIWPPWPPHRRRWLASCTPLSALDHQSTNPSDHRAPWQSPRAMCGGVEALGRPRARSRWVNGLVSFQITFLSEPRSHSWFLFFWRHLIQGSSGARCRPFLLFT